MNDPKLQEQNVQSASPVTEYKSESKKSNDWSKLFVNLNVKGFIPMAEYLDPTKKASRDIFLKDNRFKEKRENLVKELEGWIELLDSDKTTPNECVSACEEKENKYQHLLEQGIDDALKGTRQLETSYRTLESFFQNANSDNLYNLKLINVNKDYITDSNFSNEVGQLLNNAYDRLSLKDSYSLLVLPGYFWEDGDLKEWADIAFKNKVLLITDHADVENFDDLRETTQNYRDSDQKLQNVVMTANWIVGRESEKLSESEKNDEAFFIPPSAALAGKLYDGSTNMAQGAAGKEYGTLNRVKGVRNDLLKSQIAALIDNQVVPMVFSEGRVMAFNNTTLYNGDKTALKEYPIVRVFDWVKKALLHYVNAQAFENWDSVRSPANIKKKLQDFLSQHQGPGQLFKGYDLKSAIQDPVTKQITIDISIIPYFAAKNFVVKLTATDEGKKRNVDINEE